MGGLFDGAGQQRMRRQLGENPVAVLERRLDRRGEADHLAQVVHPVVLIAARHRPGVLPGRRIERDLRSPGVDAGQCRRRDPPRIGSTFGECDATSTATSRAITSRISHPATSSRMVAVSPPMTVVCGEATTATTTSSIPRRGKLVTHCLLGKLHRRHGAGTRQLSQQGGTAADDADPVGKRQRVRDDRCRDLAHGMADDRAGPHAIATPASRPTRPAWRTASAEPGRSPSPSRTPTSPRSPRTRTPARSAVRCAQWSRRTPVRCAADRRPSRPTASPGRRTPTPGRGHPVRPSPGTARRRRRSPAERRTTPWHAGDDAGAYRAVAASAGQGVAEVGQRHRIRALLQPVRQPAGGTAQFVGRGGGQREQHRAIDRGLGGRSGGIGLGCLLQDRVHIGPGDAVGRHRGAAGSVVTGWPRRDLPRHEQPGLDLRESLG